MSIPTVERRRFKVGKYDIIAHPIPNSAHMLRYTVFVGGKRSGETAHAPRESLPLDVSLGGIRATTDR
jgi:hypothetical protein